MSITGSLIKISLNIKQCAFRQLYGFCKVKCDSQNTEVNAKLDVRSVLPRARFMG